MDYLTENITFHTVINEDNPYCFYCKSECYIKVSSTYSSIDNFTSFNCKFCNERFVIYNLHNYDELVSSFEFTCKDFSVHIYYITENFSLRKLNYKEKIWINDLHNVKFDFSDKEKLYNKLKTYLMFS